MEANVVHDDVEIEEEYVLLDLDSVPGQFDISPDAPYVLSGLDTLNLILVIDNKLKLIGHYEETIGTCIAFAEEGTSPLLLKRQDHLKQTNEKQVKPLARVNKILKFKLLVDTNVPNPSAQA